MLLYVTLHSLYLCRLLTFIGAKRFFSRQLCLSAPVCFTVICNARSHLWPAWLQTHCCLQSLPTASGGNLNRLDTQRGAQPGALGSSSLVHHFAGVLTATEQSQQVTL